MALRDGALVNAFSHSTAQYDRYVEDLANIEKQIDELSGWRYKYATNTDLAGLFQALRAISGASKIFQDFVELASTVSPTMKANGVVNCFVSAGKVAMERYLDKVVWADYAREVGGGEMIATGVDCAANTLVRSDVIDAVKTIASITSEAIATASDIATIPTQQLDALESQKSRLSSLRMSATRTASSLKSHRNQLDAINSVRQIIDQRCGRSDSAADSDQNPEKVIAEFDSALKEIVTTDGVRTDAAIRGRLDPQIDVYAANNAEMRRRLNEYSRRAGMDSYSELNLRINQLLQNIPQNAAPTQNYSGCTIPGLNRCQCAEAQIREYDDWLRNVRSSPDYSNSARKREVTEVVESGREANQQWYNKNCR